METMKEFNSLERMDIISYCEARADLTAKNITLLMIVNAIASHIETDKDNCYFAVSPDRIYIDDKGELLTEIFSILKYREPDLYKEFITGGAE